VKKSEAGEAKIGPPLNFAPATRQLLAPRTDTPTGPRQFLYSTSIPYAAPSSKPATRPRESATCTSTPPRKKANDFNDLASPACNPFRNPLAFIPIGGLHFAAQYPPAFSLGKGQHPQEDTHMPLHDILLLAPLVIGAIYIGARLGIYLADNL